MSTPADDLSGVIWISGFPGAGKTTVARKVEATLRAGGLRTLALDGDDLRSIFAHRWGYERADRVDISRVYFHLCSHIAAQGLTVVISAVAMYDEVRAWLHSYVSRTLEVYLEVPADERRRRDALGKRIYAVAGDLEALYETPASPDLRIDNFGDVTADAAAARIAAFYREHTRVHADWGRTAHWQAYYAADTAPLVPSGFATDVADRLGRSPLAIADVGCGNGRDSVLFASGGHEVTGIDLSDAAIHLCRRRHAAVDARFLRGTLPDFVAGRKGLFDVVYSRFAIHAMPPHEERAFLAAAAAALKPGGRLFLEARSINDPLAAKGEVLSPTERIHGHYRRFIVKEELEARLRASGFAIDSAIEADGLAVHGDDNPVVLRVAAHVEPHAP